MEKWKSSALANVELFSLLLLVGTIDIRKTPDTRSLRHEEAEHAET
ncbi:hypothetical protein [Lentibacillus sp. Marseille-P4043]|nr:hypothetical protein [Lentibacillus sp. Marseille-P4043]